MYKRQIEEQSVVYASVYYYLELSTARMLKNLNIKYEVSLREAEQQIRRIEAEEKINLDEMQKTAVVEAARNGVLVITGGPGTGKTTTINAMIRFFENEGLEIRLAAPTGRAAKRMTEATGYEAQTIHRMLELSGGPEDQVGSHFERNEQNPLESDVIIIDEMSMVCLLYTSFGRIVPKNQANEFFGFYNIFGKFAAILGPILFGWISLATGKANYGVGSIIILFIVGSIIFHFVPDEREL